MADAELSALFAVTEAPARDYTFELAVEERVARRRMGLAGIAIAALLSLSIGALWLLWPALSSSAGVLVVAFDPAGPTLACVAVIIAASLWFANDMAGDRAYED